jgi:putative endonuclease
MTLYRQALGRSGEQLAAKHLAESGYTILETNYTTRFAEVDIIAAFENCLVFVEVKARTSRAKGLPREAVHPGKQHKIIQAARQYLKTCAPGGPQHIRFDILEIFFDNNQTRINHIPHAFDAG